MPADEAKFPVTTWFRDLLTEGVQPLVLNSLLIRRASPPGQGRAFRPDGSNLPWVIEELRQAAPERFQAWIAHLRTALPDLAGIRTVEREDDRHRYMILQYGSPQGLLEVPSWVASDGTLRLLALTLPAYLPNVLGIYLIEEPENGVHPKAVETLFQSLSSIYDAQVLMATHSPVILSLARPEQVLCFAKNEEGATDIVSGDQHPRLRDWRGEVDLGTLLAAGVLG
jgi:predicted ATPase